MSASFPFVLNAMFIAVSCVSAPISRFYRKLNFFLNGSHTRTVSILTFVTYTEIIAFVSHKLYLEN